MERTSATFATDQYPCPSLPVGTCLNPPTSRLLDLLDGKKTYKKVIKHIYIYICQKNKKTAFIIMFQRKLPWVRYPHFGTLFWSFWVEAKTLPEPSDSVRAVPAPGVVPKLDPSSINIIYVYIYVTTLPRFKQWRAGISTEHNRQAFKARAEVSLRIHVDRRCDWHICKSYIYTYLIIYNNK